MGKNYDPQWELIVIMLYEINKITSNYISKNPLIVYVEFFFLIPIIWDYGIYYQSMTGLAGRRPTVEGTMLSLMLCYLPLKVLNNF